MTKGYYHVYSFGEDTPKLLTNPAEFVIAINILAYCTTIFDVKVMAFVMMHTHFHLVLYGTEEDCRELGMKLMRMILHRTNRGNEKPYNPQEVSISADLINGKEDLLGIICYVLRNPIEAGYRYDPRFYRWCSAALYFCPGFEKGRKISSLPRRVRTQTLGVHYVYPDDWTYSEDGMINAQHFVAYREVESLFGGIRAFIAFMFIKKDRLFELNKRYSKIDFIALSDEELASVTDKQARSTFGKGLKQMDIVERISLAQKLRNTRGSGIKQLARVLDINPSVLDSILV